MRAFATITSMENPIVFTPAFSPALSLLSFLFTPQAIHFIFYAALALYALASAVLLYHWVRYNVGFFRTVLLIVVYFGGSFLLLMALLAGSHLFT